GHDLATKTIRTVASVLSPGFWSGGAVRLWLTNLSLCQPNERLLLPTGQRLDRSLSLQGQTSAGMPFLVDQLDRKPATGVAGRGPRIVLPATAASVPGDTRVQRGIGTPQQVDAPLAVSRLVHVFFRQCHKTLTSRALWPCPLGSPREHLRSILPVGWAKVAKRKEYRKGACQ